MYYRGYQKFLHVLLCEDDRGENGGRGRPVRRAGYADCIFLESTGLKDRNGREIYEGDIMRVNFRGRTFTDVVGTVPDTFGSKNAHPLESILKKHGVLGNPQDLSFEVLGNEYEGKGDSALFVKP